MDVHKIMDNWRLISIKTWISIHGYLFLRISIVECPSMDIPAWISMRISTLVWVIEDWYPKIMDIHIDIRKFLEIHAWICYGFSDQGLETLPESLKQHKFVGHGFFFWYGFFLLQTTDEERSPATSPRLPGGKLAFSIVALLHGSDLNLQRGY